MLLETSGVPYDAHFLGDVLERPELQDYRVYVFANTRYLTDAERAGIREKLQRDGRTLVFLADTGYIGPGGLSVEALSDLVGMTVRTDDAYARAPAFVDVAHAFTEGVLPFHGMSEMLMAMMTQSGQSSFTGRPQRFVVDDPDAQPLAHYDDGVVAMATRDLGDWRSVYLGVPNSLGAGMLANIAREAGAFVLGGAGHATQVTGSFVSLHARSTGPCTLNLPPGATGVISLETGDEVPVTDGHVTLDVSAQETYWLLMQ